MKPRAYTVTYNAGTQHGEHAYTFIGERSRDVLAYDAADAWTQVEREGNATGCVRVFRVAPAAPAQKRKAKR